MELKVSEVVVELIETEKLDRLISPFQLNSNKSVENYLKDEFKQELCIILLEYKKPEVLIRLYNEGRLDYFILGIIKRQLKSVDSPFWRSHNRWAYNREPYDLGEKYDY